MLTADQKKKLLQAAEMVASAGRVVVFTGAGVSTESGIPDFRGPGGLWTRFDQADFTLERYIESPEARQKHWRFLMEGGLARDAEPNAAHRAIAELEALGRLACVITQNIDNLHQKAGNSPELVFELHGNMRWIRCLTCETRYSLEKILSTRWATQEVPACWHCGGILKPDVIFFGEALPPETLDEAVRQASLCRMLIVVGSSLVVHPAATIPAIAKQAGAKLVIINLSPTPLDSLADLVITASAGEAMERLVAEVRRRPSGCA